MFALNDEFLQEIGLGGLPDEQKKPFLQHTYQQLEQRVGERLSDGMSDEQLDEFGALIDRDEAKVNSWLQQFVPEYTQREDFQKMQAATGAPATAIALLAEYAASKWLEINRPDYRDIVAQTMNDIKQEIVANKDAILGTAA